MKTIIPKFKIEKSFIHFNENRNTYKVKDYSGISISDQILNKEILHHHKIAQTVLKKRGKDEDYTILRGIIASLDAHSAMLLPEEYSDLKQGTEGVFGGLGVLVGIRDDILTVLKPIPRSPASIAGVKRGDKIISIDGHKTYGLTLDQLVNYMRGDPGTEVKLEILRKDAPYVKKISLTREIIHVDSIVSKVFLQKNKSILYVAIESFSSRTSSDLEKILKVYRKKYKKYNAGIVLDLRSNPGGLLDQAVSVANLFLKEGVIVSTRGRSHDVSRATKSDFKISYPMTVLINADSASASEIVAGALQDHGRALIIGQQSFGKGSVQTVFEIPGNSAIKLTIARYYTPKGRTIQNIGITPDIIFQPVFEKESNLNLLGDYRYRGERSLSHSLVSKSLLKNNNNRATFQSFYMSKSEQDVEPTSELDYEFQLSKVFLFNLYKHYSGKIPHGLNRVDHQLFISSIELTNFIAKKFEQVKKYLSKSYSIDWGGDRFSEKGLDIKFLSSYRLPVIPGSSALIPLRIFNNSSERIDNVSLIIQTNQKGLISKEILIGSIAKEKTLDKSVEIEIPTFWEQNMIDANIGLVVNGKLTSKNIKFYFDVKSRITAKLSTSIKLVDEKGDRINGHLDANESAKLQIDIANDSEVPANSTDVKLVNLAGGQIILEKVNVKDILIPPKSSRRLYFPISGSQKIYNKKIFIGIFIDSNDLNNPVKKELNISARPGWVDSKKVLRLSH